jgi:membrane associated rhomboid family serine protease
MSEHDPAALGSFPRPGRALWAVLLTLFAVWLAFAVGLNWGGAREDAFLLFAGNTELIVHGQVWRLLTAPLLHPPTVSGILLTLLGLYFLTPTLEREWGGARLIRFLVLSVLLAYVLQMVFQLLAPASLSERLVPEHWYGALPALEAVSIAWALTFRGQTVRLFFILPVSSRGLILFVVGVNVLYMITLERMASGLIAPFGGILSGWLFGGGTPSPARRFWLKLRLRQLEREVLRERKQRRERVAHSGLRVIEGGRDKRPDHERRGPDGRLLN